MQTTSLDRYEPPKATTSTLSTQSYKRRSNKTSYSPTPLFAPGIGTGYREQTHETSITIELWHPSQISSASTSTLSKAPLLREVPQVKRRLTRKDRESNIVVSETRSFQNLKSAAPSWLREKPSRQKLTGQVNPAHISKGIWKNATAICRDNGTLLIYGEDRALLHSISIKELSATDVRFVDDSLFVRPNVLGIFSRPSTFTAGVRSPAPSSVKVTGQNGKDEPIYLGFTSSRKLKRWKGLLRTFAKPEIYGPAQKGGTHRCYRQVDMSILEAKLVFERPVVTVRSYSVISPSLEDDDDSTDMPTGLGIKHNMERNGRHSIDEVLVRKEHRIKPEAIVQSINNLSIDAQEGTPRNSVPSDEDENDSSDQGATSGPISGISGRERILNSSPMTGSNSGFEMERKVSDGNGTSATPSAGFCVIWMAGEVVAQTKVRSGTSNLITWFDNLFTLTDLPNLSPIQIDMMQSGRNGKFGLLGTVILPMDTMRRSEKIEGWFPIWSSRTREADTLTLPAETSYADEMVGELRLSITVTEETILPLKKYSKVEEILRASDSISLVEKLSKELDEEKVISHLVDYHASSGTIVEFLNKITKADCGNFKKNSDIALLFRGNSLLTRAIDKFQRRYCKDWLEACIGPTVRRVCHDRIWLEAIDSHHYYLHPIPPKEGFNSNTIVGESNLDALLRLCRELWTSIYANRHRCPKDLRSALTLVRTNVNLNFPQATNQKRVPGIQGVGAFVFLRLICPAITAPNTYGLMGSAPNTNSKKTLVLIAKVFLALAKSDGFSQEKDPWMVKMNDFLNQQSSAFDDFITYISTEPPIHENQKEPLGDEADYTFQALIKEKMETLPSLHRESISSSTYMLDHPRALASFVSYVVRNASVEVYQEKQGQSTNRQQGNTEAQVDRQYDHFIDLCCDVEDQAGYHLDKAGYNPEPIDIAEINRKEISNLKSTHIYTAINQIPQASSITNVPPMPKLPSHLTNATKPDTAVSLNRARRATVSEGKLRAKEEVISSEMPTMSSIGEDFMSNGKVPLRFAPHLETSSGRLSMDSEEKDTLKGRLAQGVRDRDKQQHSHVKSFELNSKGPHYRGGIADQRAVRKRSGSGGGGGNSGAGGGGGFIGGITSKPNNQSIEESRVRHAADVATPEDQASLRKVKQSWWKKL